ncbi:acetyl-CoA synthetase-like protein [Lindgomyces ingoldianus]|uniref:Acetyl-CoA synthetase-like protein n=1 Tax=Lindgomyces ingoldianus TaxID=673940 RepID=A0ACB6R2M5_9PLEO|nr:acetyl-CoA synthetase-like protein [Lindgomyces ingoldianus]KAF2472767.1 acetyl-CoA synthetase-like protein [Lindgomyces ingoldianus]
MPFLSKTQVDIPTQDILSWCFDNPQYDLDQPLWIDASNPQRSVSGREARTLICKFAAGLRKNGLQPGDCVVVSSFNHLHYPILIFAIVAAGGVYTGTNPSYTAYEIAHHVNITHGKFFICEPEILKPVLDAKHDLPKEKIFIFDHSGQDIPEGFKSYKTLLDHGEAEWARFSSPTESQTTTAMLFFSSGTTGLPKAVQVSHYNIIAQYTLVFETQPRPYPISRLVSLPLFHMATTPPALIAPLRAGHTTYMMRRFELEAFLAYHEKYRITELCFIVPPIVISIIMSPLSKKYSLKSVRLAACGAAPLDKVPQAQFKELLAPEAPFTQVWGMTECSCVATMFPHSEHDATGSVGRLIPNLDIKLVDELGKDVSAPNIRAEICIRGPTITRGYFENPEANARDWDEEGYFHTGDIGFVDEGGKWYIVDRKKELIKVRGFQVAPPELEAVLLSHPSIVDAGVIGISVPTRDIQLPRAYVVQRDDTNDLTEEDVIAFAAERLAKYKRLDGGVRFVESIPKTASGKILKRTLREWAGREVGKHCLGPVKCIPNDAMSSSQKI